MMPAPTLAPSQALRNISALMRSRARQAGIEAAMSRIFITPSVPSAKRISWPESGA